ncbi:MAG: LysM peptidoglycan-binding domain-containing protein [Saprospiraceae bacterium]|nr:LysM peptidoglycan-binding domain-containing protein [Saprospiraceae bacterium]
MHKYTEIKLFLISIGILLSGFVYSQNVTKQDSIFLNYTEGKGLAFEYRVEPGNTVYSISKIFNVDISDIYSFNWGLNKKPLSNGSIILVPLNKELLVKESYRRKSNNSKVFYKVGQKETLFRIAKVYLDMDIEDLMKLNKLKNMDLSLGQILYIGYLDSNRRVSEMVSNILPDSRVKQLEPVVREKPITFNKIVLNDVSFQKTKSKKQKESELAKDKKSKNGSDSGDNSVAVAKKQPENPDSRVKSIKDRKAILKNDNKEKIEFVGVISRPVSEPENTENERQEHILKSHKDSGIALWNKQSRVRGVYVLSNDAALNTMIEINNPMVQRKIFARVIGNIPTNTYPDNVKVVLSPEAAMTLGALDSRFFVKLHYLK